MRTKVKKVKCTPVQALRLCTGQRGSRGIALPFHDHGTRRGWGVSVTPWPLFTPGKDPVPIVQEAGWAPGPVWTGAENLAPTRIRSLDRPALSQSLHQLRYQAPTVRNRLGSIRTNVTKYNHFIGGKGEVVPLHAMIAYRQRKAVVPVILNLSTGRRSVVNFTSQLLYR